MSSVRVPQAMFAEVYELDVDEDVNEVLFALPQPLQLPASASQSASAGSRKHSSKKSSQLSKPSCINGSAAGLKLLAPQLRRLMKAASAQHLSDLEGMLQNLSLCKR